MRNITLLIIVLFLFSGINGAAQDIVSKSDSTQKIGSLRSVDIAPEYLFDKGVFPSFEQLIKGHIAGVEINPVSGEPGSGIVAIIRGVSTLQNTGSPLYVIDGFPLGPEGNASGLNYGAGTSAPKTPLSFINPGDIDHIMVLKDFSATAVYGARAANGVILVTTKKGGARQRLQFSTATSITSTKTYDVLSPQSFLEETRQLGIDPSLVNRGASTDWQDQIFRHGIVQNYNLAVGGAKNKDKYRISLGHYNHQGVIENSSLKRFTGSMNASKEFIRERLAVDMALTGARVKNAYAPITDDAGSQGNLLGAALAANPTFPVQNTDGSFFSTGSSFRNPAAMLAYIDDQDQVNRYLGTIAANWKIIKGFTLKADFGFDHTSGTRETWVDPQLRAFPDYNRGRGSVQEWRNSSYLTETSLNYTADFSRHHLAMDAGYAYQKFNSNRNYITGTETLTGGVMVKDINAFRFHTEGALKFRSNLNSFYARVNYEYNDRYVLSATLRGDKNAWVVSDTEYGYSPAVSFKWNIGNEAFLSKQVFQDLAIHADYGRIQGQILPQEGYIDPGLEGEYTQQYSTGINFTIFHGRLYGTVDYFNKTTHNPVVFAPHAAPAPAAYHWTNLNGRIRNRGVEIGLNGTVIKGARLAWYASTNLTFINNIAQNFGNVRLLTGGVSGIGITGTYTQVIRDGYPLNSFVLPVFTGFNASGFATYANNGEPQMAGSALPKFYGALSNSVYLGKWALALLINAGSGFYIYNNTANALFTKGSLASGRNVIGIVADNQENAFNANTVSTRFLERGDFIRLSSAVVSYAFLLKSKRIHKLNMFLSGQNLLLLSDYSGPDPEVNTPVAINGIPSRGVDYTSYPNARMFTLGVTVGF